MNPEPEVVALLKEYYKGGSVLDLGCGHGRYRDCFGSDYTGIDLHHEHGGEYIQADFTRWQPSRKYEYLFCSVVLEQIKELPKELKTWAKRKILVEPTSLNGLDGATLQHNYLELFNPVVAIPMHNGATFMVTRGTR